MGAHAAESRARVFAPSTSEPKILVTYGFIVSIHGFVLAVTVTPYLGLFHGQTTSLGFLARGVVP
jgi:hypothetical protein